MRMNNVHEHKDKFLSWSIYTIPSGHVVYVCDARHFFIICEVASFNRGCVISQWTRETKPPLHSDHLMRRRSIKEGFIYP
jgi:hypothetical protein